MTIFNEIERNVSSYLVTITVINVAFGLAVGLSVYFCGMSGALLWGAVGFLLNYVPILGPLTGTVIFLLVGFLSFDTIWRMLLPAGIYLLLHVIEGETITPMLLARRFTLNPVIVIVSLSFWDWLWGIPGVSLSVPLLAIFKIVCDRVPALMALGHMLSVPDRRRFAPPPTRTGRMIAIAWRAATPSVRRAVEFHRDCAVSIVVWQEAGNVGFAATWLSGRLEQSA